MAKTMVIYPYRQKADFSRTRMSIADYRRENMRKARAAWQALPPERRKRKPISKPQSYGGHPLAYYHLHYEGVTRGQLLAMNTRLYHCLKYHGLLAEVPLKPRIEFPDPLAYFEEHCAGMIRSHVAKIEPQFYRYLQKHGLLDSIPFPPKVAGRKSFAEKQRVPQPLSSENQPADLPPSKHRPQRQAATVPTRFRIIPE